MAHPGNQSPRGLANIKTGKAKNLKLKFTVPAELAGQSRTLLAKVELAGDVNAANDTSTASVTFG